MTKTVTRFFISLILLFTNNLFSQSDNALYFDGVDDRVDLPASVSTNIISEGTLEAWIKTNNAGASFKGILVREFHYGIFLNDNQLMAYNWTGSGSSGANTYTGTTLNDDQWHHVAFTFKLQVTNGSQLYIDGEPVGAPFTHYEGNTAASFRIGTNGLSGQFFQGAIDDAQIWSRALSAAEIHNRYVCATFNTNPVSAYDFNQGTAGGNNTGISVLNEVVNGVHNGLIYNMAMNGSTSNFVAGHTCASTPLPTGEVIQGVCGASTLADLGITGTNLQWYSTGNTASAISSSTAVVYNTTYYVTQTISGIESERLAVTVTQVCDNALQFDGVNDVILLPAGVNTPINTVNKGTLEAWINTGDAGSGYRGILTREFYCGLFMIDNQLATFNWSSSGNSGATYSGVTINDNNWHHVVLTFQIGVSAGTQMYLDGVAVGPAITIYSASGAGASVFRIGNNGNSNQYYQGKIDDVTLWSRVLSAQEILNAYNCGVVTNTNMVAKYEFNQGDAGQLNPGLTTLNTTVPSTLNGSLYNFSLSGTTSNWVDGFVCIPDLCPTPTGAATQSFCVGSTVGDLTADGESISWYAAASGGSAITPSTTLTNGVTYYATQTTTSCESTNRLPVVVSLSTPPAAPTATSSQFVCNGSISDLSATGSSIKWYDVASGGTELSPGTAMVDGTVYYASQTVNGCESTDRVAVTAGTTVAAPTGTAEQEFCSYGYVSGLLANGTNLKWYEVPLGGVQLATNTALTDGMTYYATQTINACESQDRLPVLAHVYEFTTISGDNVQQFCQGATLADMVVIPTVGATVNWYSTSNGWISETPLPLNTLLVNGTNYYAGQNLGSEQQCKYAGTKQVYASIISDAAPTGNNYQPFCGSALVSNLEAFGEAIQWYDAPTGGTPLNSTDMVSSGMYYATQTISGCESSRFEVTADIIVLDLTVTQNGMTLSSNQNGAGFYAWLDCNNGNLQIWGENGQSFTAPSNGSYAVQIDVNGCEGTSDCINISTAGLETIKNTFELHPNPTDSKLTINTATPIVARITTASGVLVSIVELNGTTTLDVSNYAPGVYFIVTSQGETIKFMKK